jgi:hypothetical protein
VCVLCNFGSVSFHQFGALPVDLARLRVLRRHRAGLRSMPIESWSSTMLTRQCGNAEVKGRDEKGRYVHFIRVCLYVIEPHQTEGLKENNAMRRKTTAETLALPFFHLPIFLSRHAGASCR